MNPDHARHLDVLSAVRAAVLVRMELVGPLPPSSFAWKEGAEGFE